MSQSNHVHYQLITNYNTEYDTQHLARTKYQWSQIFYTLPSSRVRQNLSTEALKLWLSVNWPKKTSFTEIAK